MTSSNRSKQRFDGKVALVTGAASGMGRATCIRLASEGASVFGVDLNEAGLKETAQEIEGADGTVTVHGCDVSQRDQCFGAVEAAVAAFGSLDVLANVAGVVRFTHTTDMSEADWNLVMTVNLSGPFFLTQAAIPHLLESKGNIVNVASNAGLMGQSYTAAYCASKGGLVQLTRSLAMEYIKQGIRINCVCPAGTDTAMNRGIDFPEDLDWKLIGRFTGQRGFAAPEDLASAIAYLASDEARAVHGSIFTVDNGMMAG
ncbi:MAG: SDR family oxidoreductase [Deltaproteobacteria bacterium]|nr:SDR family oxidoreductase [Deltaproteobacteria bacterium]MBW2417910.1 SDR family oxidoreductase [Deltaproteobacteria bacterium]